MVVQINHIVFVFWTKAHNKHGFYYKAFNKRLNVHSVSIKYINYPSWGACTIPRKNIRTMKPNFGVAPGEDTDSDDDYPLLAKVEKTTCIEPAEVMQPLPEDLLTKIESTDFSEIRRLLQMLEKVYGSQYQLRSVCSKKDIESSIYMFLPLL